MISVVAHSPLILPLLLLCSMRLPAVVVNAVVWGLFLAVVIVNETVTDDNALDVISKVLY